MDWVSVTLVNIVMDLWVPWKLGYFFTSWGIISVWGRPRFHEVCSFVSLRFLFFSFVYLSWFLARSPSVPSASSGGDISQALRFFTWDTLISLQQEILAEESRRTPSKLSVRPLTTISLLRFWKCVMTKVCRTHDLHACVVNSFSGVVGRLESVVKRSVSLCGVEISYWLVPVLNSVGSIVHGMTACF